MVKIIKIIVVALFLIVVLCLSFNINENIVSKQDVINKHNSNQKEVCQQTGTSVNSSTLHFINETSSTSPMIEHKFKTLLIVGLDSEGNIKTATHSKSDTLFIVLEDIAYKKVYLLQIPRDTLIKTENGQETRIAHVYLHGGIKELIGIIEKEFGIKVNNYIVTNFTTIKELVNLIGGIQVNVDKKYCYRGIGVEKETCVEPGLQTLNGTEFLVFWRTRNYGETHISDIDRIKRQQIIINSKLVKEQIIKSLNVKFIKQIISIWDDYTISDISVLTLINNINRWNNSAFKSYILPGRIVTNYKIFDYNLPATIYIYDANWINNFLAQIGYK